MKPLKYTEFRDWLGNQQGDRKFAGYANNCPLACFVQETQKIRTQVGNGMIYVTDSFGIWRCHRLPKWAARFVPIWDRISCTYSSHPVGALAVLRVIDSEEDDQVERLSA